MGMTKKIKEWYWKLRYERRIKIKLECSDCGEIFWRKIPESMIDVFGKSKTGLCNKCIDLRWLDESLRQNKCLITGVTGE